jgi:hypothetical protein
MSDNGAFESSSQSRSNLRIADCLGSEVHIAYSLHTENRKLRWDGLKNIFNFPLKISIDDIGMGGKNTAKKMLI